MDASELPGPIAACELDNPLGRADGIWKMVWSHMVLSPEEKEEYARLNGNAEGQVEWLLGRTAAKDAFRILVQRQAGIRLGPGDVVLSQDASGQPRIEGPWQQDPRLQGLRPALSLSHANGGALVRAVVADGQDGRIGVALGELPALQDARDGLTLSEAETRLIEEREPSDREEWKVRFACARQSLARALGADSATVPRAIEIVGWGTQEGTLLASPLWEKVHGLSVNPLQPVIVHTLREENWIVACTWMAAQEN
jgi:hypothetical protein